MIRYDAEQAAFYREKLVERVETDVRDCYQCGNCSAGCPAAFTFDYTPNQVMRMLQVGLVDRVLDSKAVQLCVQCLTCSARCPRNIDIAGIFEDLKTIAVAQERNVPEHVKTFNKAFMNAVARFGRLPEFYDMATFYVGTMNPKFALADMSVVPPLLTRHKLKILPHRAKGTDEVSHIYKKTMEKARQQEQAEASAREKAAAEVARAAAKPAAPGAHAPATLAAALNEGGSEGGRMTLAYYPGCSLRHSSGELDVSTRKVLDVLGASYTEVPDWTCCGSTPAHMMDHLLAQALAARNLRQAAQVGDELLAPCPSCYQREKNAQIEIHKDDAFRAEVNEVLDKPYNGNVMVYALPEYLMKFVGEEKIAAHVKTDLSQLRVVPYYGCLLGRPTELTGECDNEQPMGMDLLLQAVGADVKWWNYKTECCGASVGMPKAEIQRRLSGKIIAQALAAGADAIVVCCPLCHVNLDLKQGQINSFLGTDYKVPILYLSQVLGLAFGLSADEVQLKKNVVDPEPLVKKAIADAKAVRAEEERKAAEKAAKEAARAAKAAGNDAGAVPAEAKATAAPASTDAEVTS